MLFFALLAACSTETGDLDPRETCEQYLDCLQEVSPAAVVAGLAAYGSDGTCWASSDNADRCAAACSEATVDLGQLFPTADACWPHDPDAHPVLETRAQWQFSWGYDWSGTAVSIPTADGIEFTLFDDDGSTYETLDCRLDGLEMMCNYGGYYDGWASAAFDAEYKHVEGWYDDGNQGIFTATRL